MAGGVAIATTCIWLALTNPYLEFEFRIAGSRVSMFWELIYWARMYIDPKKSKNMFIFFHLTRYIWEGSSMFHPLRDGVGISLSPIAGKKALSEALKEGSFI